MSVIVLHLGDSIAYGECASRPTRAYPQVAARALVADGRSPLETRVVAEPGWTSADLAAAVEADKTALADADAAAVLIGGDDLVQAAVTSLSEGHLHRQLRAAYRRYARDLAVIAAACRRRGVPLVFCTLYNPFPNSPLTASAIQGLNDVMTQVAIRLGASVAPVDAWFAGREPLLIAGYRTGRLEDVLACGRAPVHPNDLGHQLIGLGLAAYISPLAALRHRLGSTAVWHSRR
ncbi:SGNH/GDSL hydrolase family protein [Alicyclobacillus acidocaldarius]|uniref:SGNH/GDSL hydrolase family protein n=1 Tax=Alicyclobacillus acidocaldarius TaxID=405212 RepID=UPI0003100E1E|nr:SGNH/GDSL hydrolase family protein [Alicyclobacillus acidocaldarius]